MSDDIRISEVTLVNYRQYYGTIRVKFPTEENTVAVLVGANGAGKSNFWNAIHWCLFGTEPHIKSSNTTPSIINMLYLYEAEKNKGKNMLEMSVRIIMQTGDTKYLVQRQIQGLLNFLKRDENGTLVMSSEDPVPYGFEIVHSDNSTLFQISERSGRWRTLSGTHNFDNLVSQYIIPEKLSQFFILDGEFLQELFDKFSNIKRGIDQIAQIHLLNYTLRYMDKTYFKPRRKSGNDAEIYTTIERLDQELNSENKHGVKVTSSTEFIYGTDEPMHATGEPLVRDLKRTIKAMKDRKREVDRKIAKFDVIKKMKLKDKYDKKVKEKKTVEKNLSELINEHLNLLITEGPFIMCKSSIESATKLIQAEMDKGKLPNIPRRMLVNDLLAKHRCLCGTLLDEGTDARKHVEEEMQRIVNEAQYDIANDIRYHNDQFFKNYDPMLDQLNGEMADIQAARKQMDNLTEDIRALKQQLPEEDDDYSRLINEQSKLDVESDECLKRLSRVENNVRLLKAKKGDELRKLRALKMRKKDEKEARLLVEKTDIIRSKMCDIKKDVEKTVREKVSYETLRMFNNLSWKKNYAKLMIDDDYRMQIIDNVGFEIMGGLSAGEKLFLALAFIMALKRVTKYKFPFVIDSPLGKTGGNLRIRFGKHMPEMLDGSQLIMLATNTEYNNDPMHSEDSNKESPSLIELLKEKVTILEYKIDYDKESKTAKIPPPRWA